MKSSDLTDYSPLGLEEGIFERGYRFKFWQPKNPRARDVIIQAFWGGELVEEVRVELSSSPIFGVEQSDFTRVENRLEELIHQLSRLGPKTRG